MDKEIRQLLLDILAYLDVYYIFDKDLQDFVEVPLHTIPDDKLTAVGIKNKFLIKRIIKVLEK